MPDSKMDFVTAVRPSSSDAAPPAVRGRGPTDAGRELQEAARALYRFFGSQSDMAEALGTTRDTLRVWLSESPPARPRRELVERVALMQVLGRYARDLLAEDTQVGAWLRAPQPALHGASPAALVRESGQDAVELLAAQIVALAPTVPSRPSSFASVDDLRARMSQVLDDETMQRLQVRVERLRARRRSPEEMRAEAEAALEADGF